MAVDGIGDLNADGIPDLLVGSDFNLQTQVKAYAFAFSGKDGSQIHAIPNPTNYEGFRPRSCPARQASTGTRSTSSPWVRPRPTRTRQRGHRHAQARPAT
ncbi:MAG: integrin alpha [Planctomycetota bacterium]